jgi:TPR repeat protein
MLLFRVTTLALGIVGWAACSSASSVTPDNPNFAAPSASLIAGSSPSPANAQVLALLPDAKGTAAPSTLPDLRDWVVDDAGLLSDGQRRNLSATLAELSQATTHQLVLATISSLNGSDMGDYVEELGAYWQLGYNGAHNGAVILLAAKEHVVAFYVGDDLKQVLTEPITKAIVNNTVSPLSKAGDEVAGIREAVKYTALALERYAHGLPVASLAPLLQRRSNTALRACPKNAIDNYEKLLAPKVLVGSEFGCTVSNQPSSTLAQMTADALKVCQTEWDLECTIIKSSPELAVDTASPPPMVSIVQCANTANPTDAIEACSAVLALQEETEATYGEALSNRGLAYYYKGDPRSAVADWEEAVRRSPILMVAFNGDRRHNQAAEAVEALRESNGEAPAVSVDLQYRKRFDSAVLALNHRQYGLAIAELKRLALQGFSDAQAKLGYIYLEGAGVPPDPISANWWLYLAAENGNAEAQIALGKNLTAGNGIAKDYRAAAKWFRKAASLANFEGAGLAAAAEAHIDPNAVPAPYIAVHLATLSTVKSNVGDDVLRMILTGGATSHRRELETLSAKSILIPELRISFRLPFEVGDGDTRHVIVLRDIALADIAKGIARSISVRSLSITDSDIDLSLGSMSARSVNLAALIDIYLPLGLTGASVPRLIYRDLVVEGAAVTIPNGKCAVGSISEPQLRAKPQPVNTDVALVAGYMPGQDLTVAMAARRLKLQTEYLDSFEISAATIDGINCSFVDPGGQLSSFNIGKLSFAAMVHGRLPSVSVADIDVLLPGRNGRLHVDELRAKSIDYSGVISTMRKANVYDAQWLAENRGRLIPALDGILLKGLRADISDKIAPSQWESSSLESAEISLSNHQGGIPRRVAVSVSHFKINNRLGLLERLGMPAEGLSQLRQGDFEASASATARLNPDQQSLDVDASFTSANLGGIKLSAELRGVAEALFFGDRRALESLRLASIDLAITDEGIVGLVLDQLASEASKDSATFRQAAPSLARGATIFALGATAEAEKLAAALDIFIKGGKSLTIRATAKNTDGISLSTFSELLGGHPTALGTELTVETSVH